MLKARFSAFVHRGELFHVEQSILPDPRCRTFAAIGISLGVGVATTGLSYGLSRASQPQQPNLAASSAAMAETEASLLPEERLAQAQAQLGEVSYPSGYTGPKLTPEQAASQMKSLQAQLKEAQDHFPVATSAQDQLTTSQKIASLKAQIKNTPQSFAGMSTADIEGQIMKQLAQGQLDQSKKYDSQFIDSALKQEQQADPQGFAARKQLFDTIQNQINNPPKSPVSEEMERQVEAKVNAGQGLTADEQQMLSTALAARGGGGPAADFSRDLTTGFAGEARGQANAAAGVNWLASGQTPEDIAYRSNQQNLANLGAYIGNQTPQSEFASLSGAQSGPTPVTQGAALPTLPSNAQSLGTAGALSQYGAQIGQAQNTANPWLAGLSGILGVGNTLGAAGWKPLSTP